ncbi:MAG TPA: PQQ-dependent sugar dehydrogenase [Candidatus Paceibacterota bacterium]|nr:PQQ-dependent sugar dehydrogenase [Candidatus Paceibacterota bacterium]
MKNIILAIGTIIVVALVAYVFFDKEAMPTPNPQNNTNTIPPISIIAEGLEIPWDIAFVDGGYLVTQRTGSVVAIDKDGNKREIQIQGVKRTGEGGLLGIVLHPDFETNRLLYLYMTAPGRTNETENRVVRFKYENGTLTDDGVIINNIPGAIYHDGGRMEFGPDGMLYVTTGDATRDVIAQNKNSLGGKILRLEDDGKIPADNPFGTAVWSYGHRNPQGLAWDSQGQLWETEHGRSGVRSGMDEINLIEKGANYGWPDIEGDETKAGMETPALHSGPDDTWAPASAAIIGNRLFFGGLLGEALYEVTISGNSVTNLKEHFKGEYGRIRTVRVGPDGMLYITTSNRDGRGSPNTGDDKVIRVNPERL